MTQQSNYRRARDLKSQATGVMTGRFTIAVMITLSYIIWAYLISFSGSIITSIISKIPVFSQINTNTRVDIIYVAITTLIAELFSLLTSMFSCGLCLFFLKISTGQMPMSSDLFYGFRNEPQKVFLITLFINMPVLILSFFTNIFAELYSFNKSDKNLLIVAIAFGALAFIEAIYMHLTYWLAYYMMLDFPKYSAGKILDITRKKMISHRARLLSLEIRFIPLAILGILSMGIGFFWIYPLIEESRALFFLNLMNPDHYVSIDERV